MKKVLTIIGTRPQFVKAAPLSIELRKSFEEIIVHTGQHYDKNMSASFFEELNIPKPNYNLDIGGLSHGEMTAKMLTEIEKVLDKKNPDVVIVFGDTNSTVAGALAAVKLQIPVVHVEAGMRSFDKTMPEEINRIVTDHCSDLLLCSTKQAVDFLKNEGLTKGVYLVGDIMYDAALIFEKLALEKSNILERIGLEKDKYMLATIHREANTNSEENLKNIFEALIELKEKIVLPLHPRTKKYLEKYKLYDKVKSSNVLLIEPVSYLDMISLEKNAKKILTDSGGVQKEAYFFKKPCVTLRENTEWVETVEDGWNILVGTSKIKIIEAIKKFNPSKDQSEHYGKGDSAKKMVEIICDFLSGFG